MPAVPVPDGTQSVGDVLVSIVRTVVPSIVGAGIAWLLTQGLDLSAYTNAVNLYLVPACIAGYYAAVRWLETQAPVFGLLLGYRATPKYIAPSAEPVPAPRGYFDGEGGR